MDRKKWLERLDTFGWLCGHCQKGSLQLDRKLMHSKMSASSAEDCGKNWWELEMGEWRFAALAVCNACADPVAVGGVYRVNRQQIDWGEYEDSYTYLVHTITPPPLPFPLDKRVPDTIADRLRAAAGLLWTDHDAAGNKIRQAVEVMLDERKINKTELVASRPPATQRRRKALNLHRRIELYRNADRGAADHLMAIKWIGNAGSHAGDEGLTREQILDALEIMEIVLEEVYVGHRAAIAKKVGRILRRSGPLPAPRPRDSC